MEEVPSLIKGNHHCCVIWDNIAGRAKEARVDGSGPAMGARQNTCRVRSPSCKIRSGHP
jgi:hypothetical protein